MVSVSTGRRTVGVGWQVPSQLRASWEPGGRKNPEYRSEGGTGWRRGDSRLLGARAPSDEKSLTSLAKFPALCCRSLLPTTDESHSQSTGDIPGRSSFIPLAYRLAYWYAVCEVLLSFSPLTSFIPVRHAVLE